MNEKNNVTDIEFEQPLKEELEEEVIPKSKIFTDQGDPEIDSLYGKYKKGKLILQPDFQRNFVWKIATASRLIESALLEIPCTHFRNSFRKRWESNTKRGT